MGLRVENHSTAVELVVRLFLLCSGPSMFASGSGRAALPPGLSASACPCGLLGIGLSPSGADVICWTTSQLFTHPWPSTKGPPDLQSQLGGTVCQLMGTPYYPRPMRCVTPYPAGPRLLLYIEPASLVRCSLPDAVCWLELSPAGGAALVRRD